MVLSSIMWQSVGLYRPTVASMTVLLASVERGNHTLSAAIGVLLLRQTYTPISVSLHLFGLDLETRTGHRDRAWDRWITLNRRTDGH